MQGFQIPLYTARRDLIKMKIRVEIFHSDFLFKRDKELIYLHLRRHEHRFKHMNGTIHGSQNRATRKHREFFISEIPFPAELEVLSIASSRGEGSQNDKVLFGKQIEKCCIVFDTTLLFAFAGFFLRVMPVCCLNCLME